MEDLIPNGESAVADDVAFLLGDDRTEAHRSELGDGLNAVIAARNRGGDEAGRRRLERDVSDLELLEELVPLSLVGDRDRVGGVELTLRVVVDVDVNPLGYDAGGPQTVLKVDSRLERRAAGARR